MPCTLKYHAGFLEGTPFRDVYFSGKGTHRSLRMVSSGFCIPLSFQQIRKLRSLDYPIKDFRRGFVVSYPKWSPLEKEKTDDAPKHKHDRTCRSGSGEFSLAVDSSRR